MLALLEQAAHLLLMRGLFVFVGVSPLLRPFRRGLRIGLIGVEVGEFGEI
ncbi:MAG: hypothetical protein IT321_12830 [Anaerolineae bacterium]|nr:hypothetical protein [Anaerolineae bacterium]